MPFFVFLIALTIHCVSPSSLWADDARPNIVLMMADDMGYSDIGCYGGEIRTPNLDKLARDGLRFMQFYNTARCCPTRASLMSGLYPHQAGVGHMINDTKQEGYRGQINNNCVTIAEVLKAAGYATFMSGKWHLSRGPFDQANGSWPCQRGYDRFFGTITGAGSFYTPTTLTRDNTPIEAPKKGFYYTDAICDNAVTFITEHHEKNADQPFFLYVAFTSPHWPLHALKEDIAKYRGKYRQGWEALRKERYQRMVKMGLIDAKWKMSDAHPNAPDWSKLTEEKKDEMDLKMAIYAAMIDRMDQGVGKIMEALKDTGEWDNTIIFFLADNGGCAEGGNFGFERNPGGELGTNSSFASYGLAWANASNTPFRLFKHWVHAGGVSTPLIVHWPNGIPENQRGQLRQQPGHLIDIMPTCVELAKAKYPSEFKENKIRPMEGKSLVPAFANKNLDREAIYWEHEGNRAVRMGKWKLVADGPKGAWELYDLEIDRTETNDLAKKHPEMATKLANMWQAYAERAFVLPLRPYAKKKAVKLNPKKEFELKPGTELTDGNAPSVAKTVLRIEAQIGPKIGDGVILSHGGTAHGYALFVKDGKLAWCIRRNGKLTTIIADEALKAGEQTVGAMLNKQGKMTITVDGKTVATGKAPGALTSQPVAGLMVGSEIGDSVGNYEFPNRFQGEIRMVQIRLGQKKK